MNAKKINNNFEPYKRVVKFVGSAIIVLLELAAYYYVWMNYPSGRTVLTRNAYGRASRSVKHPQRRYELVVPRPERPELAKVITKNIPEFEYRLKVKGGLTGYAQVHGRVTARPATTN